MTEESTKINYKRDYRDNLFKKAFSKPEDLLSLYNAISGRNYSNPDDIEITTLDDVIFIERKNDISFLVDCSMNLYEHQSSYNPNMPIRGLFYFARVYANYVEKNDLHLFGTQLLKLPTPQYCVFYNGSDEMEDYRELKLSDSFQHPAKGGCIEITAKMYNINYGRNKELLAACKRLEEYSYVVDRIKKAIVGRSGEEREVAIYAAIDDCIKSDKLKDILIKDREEVKSMLLSVYDEEKLRELDIRDAEARGEIRGEEKSQIRAVYKMHKDFNIPIQAACKSIGISYEAYQTACNNHPELFQTSDNKKATPVTRR